MCRSDGLIGLSSTRTSASPGANSGVGISASFNTLFRSPVSRKINAFIDTSWIFRQRLHSGPDVLRLRAARIGAGDDENCKHETEISNAHWRRYAVPGGPTQYWP